jgi:hypothetical protein
LHVESDFTLDHDVKLAGRITLTIENRTGGMGFPSISAIFFSCSSVNFRKIAECLKMSMTFSIGPPPFLI